MSETNSQDLQDAAQEFLDRCLQELPGLAKSLTGVVGGREAVFLDLGSRMLHFQEVAEGLTAKAEELTAMASGGAVSEFAGQLEDKLRNMTTQCDVLTGSSIQERLVSVLEYVKRLQEQVQNFSRVIRRLEMLGISTRIESARLGAEGLGFHTLADDVQKLADRIVLYSEQIGEKSAHLTTLTSSALHHATAMRDMQKTCSQEIFTVLRANIVELEKLMESSRQASRAMEPRTREIAREFGEIVASLQFHDITRQQVEHVEEALQNVFHVAEEQGVDGQRLSAGEITGFVADVCELQASQLDNAANRMVQAVERIRDSLVQVAGGVDELAAMAGSIGREEATGGDFALSRIRDGITHTVDTMQRMESQGASMAEVMVSVADTVAEMDAFVEDIENVGAEIELIAINASIKAARTGEKGRALGVLATSIQMLSKEAGAMTDTVAGILRNIAETSASLKLDTNQYLDAARVESSVQELMTLLASLQQADSDVSSLFSLLDNESGELSSEARNLAQGIEFHHQIADELQQARREFIRWGGDARAIWPDSHRGGDSRLNAMLERYTMEAERQVHESAFAQPGAASEAAEALDALSGRPGIEGGAEADDWDNVELF